MKPTLQKGGNEKVRHVTMFDQYPIQSHQYKIHQLF